MFGAYPSDMTVAYPASVAANDLHIIFIAAFPFAIAKFLITIKINLCLWIVLLVERFWTWKVSSWQNCN